MAFSFNPNQEQASAPAQQVTQTNSNGVPALVVPAPVITLTPVAEVISPFAYKNRNKSKFGVYVQGAIFFVFLSLVIASVILFVYQSSIKVQIDNRKDELTALEETFKKPKDLEEIRKLSARLALINKIIDERVSVNTAFTILEESINSPVVYDKFSLSKSKKDKNYDLAFSGQTNSYKALYQQIEVINSKWFKNYLPKLEITGIGPLDKKGVTSFKVNASIAIGSIDPAGFSAIASLKASSTLEVASSSDPVTASSTTTSIVDVIQ
ncbi:MAG: hypothetical protein KBC41_03300 [Candidatus Pacebacteria bacterium]|nr:hypothetical protein [Candidatus Paceibacterota bacterium]MBP9867074.1 hypothetical protein [Candidatus Paceibacterota bacterium]